jgi:acyl-CoA thioester hydrolase
MKPVGSLRLPDLDLAAPMDRYRTSVGAEWVDLNGHMNLAYYMVAFDKAADVLLDQIGVGVEYTKSRLGMIFVLEAHVTYARELLENDPIRVSTQILDHDRKLLHLFHHMYRGDEEDVVATSEALLIHVNFESRRSAPWPQPAWERLEAMAKAHSALPYPPQAGSKVGIRD